MNKHRIKYLFFTTVLIALSVLLISCTIGSFIEQNRDYRYTVKFYDNEYLLEIIVKSQTEPITNSELEAVMENVPDENEKYIYHWSFDKNGLEEVDFTTLTTSATVYLYRELNKQIRIKVLNEDFTYDGQPHLIEYVVLDSGSNVMQNIRTKITYEYLGQEVDQMLNAGKYQVTIEYLDNIYYCEPYQKTIEMKKATPLVSVSKSSFVYDGSTHEIKLSDVITNSDGTVTISNNYFLNAGNYEMEIKIAETANFQALVYKHQVVVSQIRPTLLSNPTSTEGLSGDCLSTVGLTGGSVSVDGYFEWLNPKEVLRDGTNQYVVKFVPLDKVNYEELTFTIDAYAVPVDELLRRVQVDKNQIKALYQEALEGEVDYLPYLWVEGPTYGSTITWLTDTTALKVERDGVTFKTDVPGTYHVELYGILTLGSAAEYVCFSFDLVIK